MTLLQQLQSAFAGASTQQLTERADDLVHDIEVLAAREGRPLDELVLSLLSQGLEARRDAQRTHHGWQSLSLREKQVTALVCQGLTSRQVAARLVLSPETVKTHMRHILRKFGLRSRRDLCQSLECWSFGHIPDG